MRDPNRIEPTMNELTELWKTVPDMRLGQFLSNIMGEVYSLSNKRDPFFIEDAEFMKLVNQISWLKKDN